MSRWSLRPVYGEQTKVQAVSIDMTGRKESKIEFLHLIVQQYPSRVGVLTQQVGALNNCK